MGAIEKKEHSDEHLSEASTPHVKKFKDDCDSTASTPISERLPPYARTWSNDFFNFPSSSGSRWTPRIHSSWNSRSDDDLGRAWQKTKSGVRRNWDVISNDSKKWHWNKKETWSTVKSSARRWSVARKHLCAVLLLITFGLLPVGIVGYYTPRKYYAAGVEPFYGAFQDKVVGCNGPWNDPKDSLTHGLENLFVLDATFGHYTFAQVKLIDVAWDVLLGRSVQLLAWWIGYVVFSGALLRAIERHSASFQIFQSIALEGPSLMSLWTLLQEMWRSKSKRTRMLFAYMWMSTMYIMCIQMFLGAMTGYDSTNVAFVGLNGTDNLVPVAAVQRATIIKGTVNETFDHPICLDYSWDWPMYQSFDARRQYCRSFDTSSL